VGGWCGGSPHSSRCELIRCLGEIHKRQRKGMMPAFGLTASRELLPRFVEVLDKVSDTFSVIYFVTTSDLNGNSSMRCGKILSQTLPTKRRRWMQSNGLVEQLLTCGCPHYAPFLCWTTDVSVESGKVRIRQDREADTDYGDFSVSCFRVRLWRTGTIGQTHNLNIPQHHVHVSTPRFVMPSH